MCNLSALLLENAGYAY